MAQVHGQSCRSVAPAAVLVTLAMPGPKRVPLDSFWVPSRLRFPSRLTHLPVHQTSGLASRLPATGPASDPSLYLVSRCFSQFLSLSPNPPCVPFSSLARAFLTPAQPPVDTVFSPLRRYISFRSELPPCRARQARRQVGAHEWHGRSCPLLSCPVQSYPSSSVAGPPSVPSGAIACLPSSHAVSFSSCFSASLRNQASPPLAFSSSFSVQKINYSSASQFPASPGRVQRGAASSFSLTPSGFPNVRPSWRAVPKSSRCPTFAALSPSRQAYRRASACTATLSSSSRSVSSPTSGCRRSVHSRHRYKCEGDGESHKTASSSLSLRASSVVFLVLGSLLLVDLLSSQLYGQRKLLALFIVANGAVFAAWQLATGGGRLQSFLFRNFVLSLEGLRHGRLYTFLTACLSHRNAMHLVLNLFFIQQLFGLLSSDLTDRDFVSLFGLSSFLGGVGHFLASRSPVLGASAFAYSLLWVEATRNSRELFRILPIPFLPVTALQFAQLGLLTELTMALLSRPHMVARFPSSRLLQFAQGISWTGHLGGLTAGCLYSWYQRRIERDGSWKSFLELTRRYGVSDW
ncbi:rhomboid protease rom6 [Cystoisospora suis]|uniref:Rhomboid protease rom6 n=1 Tax=Cystoisospora suis TaxID=483139 RepID=A0A2C6L4A9_9APIC|nr:rhomboid protease rom6 [Cystoisospora suis]